MKTVLTVVGTRPEVIKMARLIELLNNDEDFGQVVCATGQHRELLTQALDVFGIQPDFNLQVMTENQTLADVTAKILTTFTQILNWVQPDIVLVHGDTTTSMACALAAFYQQIPVGHVEAGLRTKNRYNPFPEEMNRTMTAKLATLHFAPTQQNLTNLLDEGVPEDNIFVTGNTVIDTLLSVADKPFTSSSELIEVEDVLSQPFILVTGHRRENFGQGFEDICEALLQIAQKYPTHHIIYPVHLNPNVREVVHRKVGGVSNIHLIQPLSYLPFVHLMKHCKLILTDSGGVQEEAPSLNKPVLVMRESTERTEALTGKTIQLVGTDPSRILSAVSEIIEATDDIVVRVNPYGDGHASERIISALRTRL